MQHPVTTEYECARQQTVETLHAVNNQDLPALWFWPNVDAGSDGTSNAIRAFREVERSDEHSLLQELCADRLSSARSQQPMFDRQLERRDPRVLLPGCARCQHRTRQDGRDRGSNVTDVPHDRCQIEEAIRSESARVHGPNDALYGDGRAGERIARLLAEQPLKIEKRLTYQ